jgi:hypothetical protein
VPERIGNYEDDPNVHHGTPEFLDRETEPKAAECP